MTKRIFRSIVLVSALVLTVGLFLVMEILYQYFGQQTREQLRNEANYLAAAVETQGTDYFTQLPGVAQQTQRITLIAADGSVLYDSKVDEESMDNHKDRQEVRQALLDGTGESTRYSRTLSEKTVYYAVRLSGSRVLRVSSTQFTAMAILGGLIQPILIIFFVMLALAGIFASRVSKKITAPINELNLEDPQSNEAYDEIAPLLGKINRQKKTIEKQLALAKRQQEEFSIITENMREGLLVIDRRAQLLSCNSSALRLLHAQPAQNHNVLTLNRTEPFQHAVERALDGEHETVTLQIGQSYCQVIANPVLREGAPAGAVILLVDVTEKTLREELRREFTANVSHELKTPLTSISGFAEIMQDGMVESRDIRRFASRIFEEAQRLIRLVEDVIKISQLDEGQLPYEKEPVDLFEMAQKILGQMEAPAQKANVSLHLEGEHVVLSAVRPILEEVCYNLCDNAVKYNRKGGNVTVSVQSEKDSVCLRVRDTGIGIDEANRKRIFERFYRVDKSHSKEIGGTGLGLSIVKHGAAYLGAQVALESVPGQGSVFTLSWKR